MIDDILPRLLDALRASNVAVLQAPPGAGKTTRVPLALLDAEWLGGMRIVMLEPRRLAARAAAHWMSRMLGEKVGTTVGYRMRMESLVGPSTRIVVVTEGVLARMLQHDAALDGVGIVIFDEYHERSLQADLGLALTLQSQSLLRGDLRILVMSATLDADAVAQLLGDAPLVTSSGRSFPVDVRYVPRRVDERVESATVSVIRRALAEESGDILVFLPGAAEIRRVDVSLRSIALAPDVDITPLYGNLPQHQQDLAIAPSRAGRRKVVLSTSIAETSLTIDGITTVIDSGLMRVPRFSPRSGMTRLETVRVTRASAAQRSGRAGRLGPGVCYRLWTAIEQQQLLAHGQPEILEADLAGLALELAAWGIAEPGELRWLDAPPQAAFAQARELLRELGALDERGAITPHGRAMSEVPLHPRLAHMTLRGIDLDAGSLACDIAALLSERDVFRSSHGGTDPDLRLRLEAMADAREYDDRVDTAALRRVKELARTIRSRVGIRQHADDIEMCGEMLACAYPDRVGARREGQRGRFLLRNGRAAVVALDHPLAEADFIAVAELDGSVRESRVYVASPIDRAAIDAMFADQYTHESIVEWVENGLRAKRLTRLGAIVMREDASAKPDADEVAGALIAWIRAEGPDRLPWTKSARALQQRIEFVRQHVDGWPDVSDRQLIDALDEWLRPHLIGITRRADVQRIDLNALILEMLTWEQRRQLDQWAPTHLEVPSGSHIAIDYSSAPSPTLSVRLQEMFGATETPRILGGRIPLTLHLLSPAGRPAQVTRDLTSFWESGYFDVRKDLRGRYPKHYWPDDPLHAEPTRRTKRTSP